MATARTKTNSKPPQVEISAQSAVGVGSTGNVDEELKVSSRENAERVSTDEDKVKDSIGNTARDKQSAEAEDEESCPSTTWRTIASFFSSAWNWLRGSRSAADTLNCSICDEPLGWKKSQLKEPDAASTIRCQK